MRNDGAARRTFGQDDLGVIRREVVAHAAAHGLTAARCTDVAIVVSELATNSIQHGGGGGTLASWTLGRSVVHEVHDGGHITDPAPGSILPPPDQAGGRGLWLVNQISDRVERDSTALGGTTTWVSLGPRDTG